MNIYMHMYMYIYRMLHNNECLYVHFEQLYMQQSMFILHRRKVLEWFLLHITIGNIVSTSRTILLCGVNILYKLYCECKNSKIRNQTHVHNLYIQLPKR